MVDRLSVAVFALALFVASAAAAADGSPYTYVQFSLGVPWALYFMFLALVLIPFAVMIALAWRHSQRNNRDAADRTTPRAAGAPSAERAREIA